jgi:two-component system, LuxR family, response regulator FixJ
MIFIVDDDAAVRDSLRLLLECEGFEAQEFGSGRQFLDVGRPGQPRYGDCLILDVHMPGMSGLELLEMLRRCGDVLPAILITRRPDAASRERARPAGALAVVEKPHRPEKVVNLVRLALNHGP